MQHDRIKTNCVITIADHFGIRINVSFFFSLNNHKPINTINRFQVLSFRQ